VGWGGLGGGGEGGGGVGGGKSSISRSGKATLFCAL